MLSKCFATDLVSQMKLTTFPLIHCFGEKIYSRDLRFQVFAVFFPDGGMYADVVNGFHAILRTHLANLRGEKSKKTLGKSFMGIIIGGS